MISLGFVTSMEFVIRYTNETERYVFPIAEMVNGYMLTELQSLVESRRKFIADYTKIQIEEKYVDSTNFY